MHCQQALHLGEVLWVIIESNWPYMEKPCPKAFLVHQGNFFVVIALLVPTELQTGQGQQHWKGLFPPYSVNVCSALLQHAVPLPQTLQGSL